MAQRLADAAGSRWHEWVIVASIVALAAIGFAAIWGGSIRRWVSEGGDGAEVVAPAPGGPRL